MATVFAFFAFLILAKSILIPMAFALLLSFILFPLVKRFEKWGINKIFSAFLSIFMVFLIFGGVIFLFSSQIIQFSKEFSNFQDKIINSFADVTFYINKNVSFFQHLEKDQLFNKMRDWLIESTGVIVKKTFSSTTSFLTGLVAFIIFTFLILLYRNGLIRAFSKFSPKENKDTILKMYKSVQQVGQKYLSGMLIVIFIIGFANSLGLWIIGIDNPILFGFLGAMLSIIPYVGTISGAIFPMLYAFASYDSLWIPLYVALLFWAVQLLTDNILSPKIVGSHIKINAFAAILSLIIGASIWGVAGMILFLPFTAMFKVVCEQFEELKPLALLIGQQNYIEKDDNNQFNSKWFQKVKGKVSAFFKKTKA
jgi:predicted PurR-regulated permease PerM